MAVLIEAWEVIARRTAVEATFPGGLEAWCRAAPNHTACADRALCRVGFMHEGDAGAFVAELERVGLRGQEGGVYRDVAIIGPGGPWLHECPWLAVGTYAGLKAAWLAAADPDPMVVPLRWRRSAPSIFHLTAEETARRLKFLRREGDVEVYLDTETGRELYRGRTTPPSDVEEELERRFEATAARIQPLLTFDGHPRKLGWFERRRLKKGIGELEALMSAGADAWPVWWTLGMARRAASDPDGAYRAFKRAYDANPGQPDVAREYAGQCLALGKGDEAVAVGSRACAKHPGDAGLRSNLALAYVIAGQMEQARSEVEKAIAMDPSDAITRALEGMIGEVMSGRRARPLKYP